MPGFIHNKGTSAHRGVWHLAESVEAAVHPSEVKTETYNVIDWAHPVRWAEMVDGQPYRQVRYSSNYATDVCQTCGVAEDRHPIALTVSGHNFNPLVVYPIIATTTVIVTYPSYTTFKATAACGSGKFRGSNIVMNDIYRIGTSKKYAGKTIKVAGGRLVDNVYRHQVVPPEPFCGHCAKKLTDGGLEVEIVDAVG